MSNTRSNSPATSAPRPSQHITHISFFICKSRCLAVGTFHFYWRWMKKINNVRYTRVLYTYNKYIYCEWLCNVVDMPAPLKGVSKREQKHCHCNSTQSTEKNIYIFHCFDAGLSFDPKVLHHGSNLNMTWRIILRN